jgi:hypothetical protein
MRHAHRQRRQGNSNPFDPSHRESPGRSVDATLAMKTDPLYQRDVPLTRDFTERAWGAIDAFLRWW